LYRQFHEEGDREGMKDPEVLGLAASLSRILVTRNVRSQGATSSPSFLRGVETNAFAHEPFEAGSFDGDVVEPGLDESDKVTAGIVGVGAERRASFHAKLPTDALGTAAPVGSVIEPETEARFSYPTAGEPAPEGE